MKDNATMQDFSLATIMQYFSPVNGNSLDIQIRLESLSEEILFDSIIISSTSVAPLSIGDIIKLKIGENLVLCYVILCPLVRDILKRVPPIELQRFYEVLSLFVVPVHACPCMCKLLFS